MRDFFTTDLVRWGVVKFTPGISRVLRGAETEFQRLYLCLPGPAVQWCCRRYHRKSRYTGNRYGGAAEAVDAFDQEVGYYTCARKTRRWPMRLFFFILDTVCLNAFVLWTIKKSGKEAWSMSILS